jgi:hypothetical protein
MQIVDIVAPFGIISARCIIQRARSSFRDLSIAAVETALEARAQRAPFRVKFEILVTLEKTPERKAAIRVVAAPIGANEARSVKSERATNYRGTNSEATARHRRHSRSGAHRGEECSG